MELVSHGKLRDVHKCDTCDQYHWSPVGLPPFCHVAEVKRRGEIGACEIRRRDGWPYGCPAKGSHPDDVVWGCLAHATWWHGPAEYTAREDASYYDNKRGANWAVRHYPHSGYRGTTPRLVETGLMAGKWEVVWAGDTA